MFKKKDWRPFEEAREFTRSLNLKSSTEWIEYCNSGKDGIPKPDDIPSNPHIIYKNNGWKGYPDWLGNENRKKPEPISKSTKRKISKTMKGRKKSL